MCIAVHLEEPMIRSASSSDADAIAQIYNHYILNAIATFEEEAIAPSVMAERMAEVQKSGLPWLVLEQEGQVLGYAYASKWKDRSAYRFAAVCSVYLAPGQAGQGYGTQLYEPLFAALRAGGFHTVIAIITLPNPASVALHERFGLRKVAHFTEVGFKFGRWIDVGYWQRLL
jgi:phosphinothricin acetyltransferase